MATTDVAPHNMTAPALPEPYVASSDPAYGPSPAWHAFDGNTVGYTLITDTSGYWKIDLGAAHRVTNYSVAVNVVPEPSRAPKDWTLQGSNNDADWTTLDTITNQTAWGSGEVRNFVCDDISTAYRYFKLVITDNNGDGSYTQLEELYLYKSFQISVHDCTDLREKVGG